MEAMEDGIVVQDKQIVKGRVQLKKPIKLGMDKAPNGLRQGLPLRTSLDPEFVRGAYHEAAHAVISELHGFNVQQISAGKDRTETRYNIKPHKLVASDNYF